MPLIPAGGLQTSSPSRRGSSSGAVPPMTGWSRAWFVGLGLGALAFIGVLTLPYETPVWLAIYLGSAIVALIVFLVAILRLPRAVRPIWWALWAFQVLTFVGETIHEAHQLQAGQAVPTPWADAFYLAAFVGAFLALGLLARRLDPGRDRETWIESLILAVAAASIVGTFIVGPALTGSETSGIDSVMTVADPLLDLAVLAMLIWIMTGSGGLTPVLSLLLGSFSMFLSADLISDYRVANGLGRTGWAWLEAFYLGGVILMTAAVTSPGAGAIATAPDRRTRPASRTRLLALVVGVIAVPVLLAVAIWNGDLATARVLVVAALAVVLLALWRGSMLVDAIERERQLNELILDSAADGIVGLDSEGIAVFANLAARRLLGSRETDIVGHNFHDVSHFQHADGTPFPWQDCPSYSMLAHGDSGKMGAATFFRRDGSPLPVDVVMSPVLIHGVTSGAVLTFRDESERATVEDMKRQFIAVASHELRTPLTSLKSSLHLVESGQLGPVTAEQRQHLSLAQENSERLRILVNEILDVESLDAGRLPIRPERVLAVDLAERAVSSMEGAAQAAGIELANEAGGGGEPAWLEVDPYRMHQVLTILLGNAIKYSERSQQVVMSVRRDRGSVVIEVRDSGVGIPAERLASIFDRPAGPGTAPPRNGGSTGLDLRIAHQLVTRSGGQITAESVEGVGSTFRVRLPAAA